MNRVLKGFFVLLCFMLSACERKTAETTPNLRGDFEGRHYRNHHFGIEMTIPEAWDLHTEGVGERIAVQADARMPHMADEFKAVRPKLDYVFKALRRSEAEPGEPWLQITVVLCRDARASGITSSEEYARRFLKDIERGAKRLDVVEPLESVRLNGLEFSRLRYFVAFDDISIYQSAYFRLVGPDVACISASYGTDAHIKILESIIGEKM